MADDELAAIRARRMAELQQQQGGGDERMKAQAEQKAREEEMANVILGQCLEQGARARLNTIALAKPEKAKMVESYIIRMAKTGQLQGQLSEKALIGLLEQVSSSTQKTTTVKFDRRRAALDDSDDDM